jgi:hypothetical protein
MIEFSAIILTNQRMTSVESGHAFFGLLAKYFPTQIPDRFGDCEPLKFRLRIDDPHSIDQIWGNGIWFIAERSKPRVSIFVQFCLPSFRRQRHTAISLLRFQVDSLERVETFRCFVCEAAEVFAADYASAHILTRTELAERINRLETSIRTFPAPPGPVSAQRLRDRVEREGFASVLSMMRPPQQTVHLVKCLPELSWLTVFGKPYIDMFGRDKILTAPAHRVDQLASGAIALTLTDGLEDSHEGWDRLKLACNECKVHLGPDAFCDFEGEPRRSPQFVWLTEQSDSPQIM